MCISILVNTTCDPLLPAFLCSRRYLPDLAVVNINEQLRFPRQKRLQFQVMARLIRLADKGHGSYVSFFLTNVILGEHDLQNAPGSVCVCVFNCWKEIIVYTYFILFHRMFYGLAMGILRWTEVVPEQRTTKVEALLVAYWSYQPHRYKRLLYHRRLKPFVVFIIPLSCEALKSMCIDLVCVLDVCVGEPISPRIEATPLICCMLGRSFHAAAVLIAAGADVHLTNYEGQECKLNQLRKILQKLVVSWNLAESLELT